MNTAFNRTDLLTIINNTLDGLEAKHPKDLQSITIIRKSIEQLAREASKSPSRKDAAKSQGPLAGAYIRDSALGDLIAAAGVKLFTTSIHEPATISSIFPQMRQAVPGLPAGDHAAKVAISRAFSTRTHQFKAFDGAKSRDPLRWHVKR